MKAIKLLFPALLSALALTVAAQSAPSSQVIRGRVVDEDSNAPLIGVTVLIISDGPVPTGATTDVEGYFEIRPVPLGRHTLVVSYVGYEEQRVHDVIVTAGKESVVNVALRESVSQLDEITVTSSQSADHSAATNDLAAVSARSFNVDDTKRYAGALGDPSRMAANFAGVVGGNDSRNDIVVRGNSPGGMLWQLEGLNIPNPNHFGSLNSTGGPVSMLNNNNLDKSDFMTSAFPAQYGNATAGVFDLRLREGNRHSSEFLGQVGFNGFEVGAEGPFKKGGKASYIANYRYSTLGLFQTLGLEFGTGTNTPLFQDVNFKISLPWQKGRVSVFGIGGTSRIDLLGSEIPTEELDEQSEDLFGDENLDIRPRYRTGIVGATFERNISAKTFIRLTAGVSYTGEEFTTDSLVRTQASDDIQKYRRAEGELTTQKASVVFITRTKLDARNSLTSGLSADFTTFNLFNRDVYANLDRDSVRVDVDGRNALYQAHTTWKHRFGEKLVLNAGIHGQYYSVNRQGVLEPRVNLVYQLHPRHFVSAGYGLHNQVQNIYTAYAQQKDGDRYLLPNLDLQFTTNSQYVIAYEWYISANVRMKLEGYHQALTNVPVERRSSSYSAINSGLGFAPDYRTNLVNEGTGTNSGAEVTIEQFFHKGYYYLITGSLFESTYKGSDGIRRNTAYNTEYVANVLAGKEILVGRKRNYLTFNLKATFIGGRYLTPVDIGQSAVFGRPVYVDSEAYSEKQSPYFRADFRVSYRKEYRKSTLEFSLDLQNVTANRNIFSQTYNPRTNSIATEYQQGFFPVPFIRYTF